MEAVEGLVGQSASVNYEDIPRLISPWVMGSEIWCCRFRGTKPGVRKSWLVGTSLPRLLLLAAVLDSKIVTAKTMDLPSLVKYMA